MMTGMGSNFLWFALAVGLIFVLTGCHAVSPAPSMTPDPSFQPIQLPGWTFSYNQQVPNYTGGDRPCSNARLSERVVCGHEAPGLGVASTRGGKP
jgi:hypothetical protein